MSRSAAQQQNGNTLADSKGPARNSKGTSREGKGPVARTRYWPLIDEGPVTLSAPSILSPESYQDLADRIEIWLRGLKRRSDADAALKKCKRPPTEAASERQPKRDQSGGDDHCHDQQDKETAFPFAHLPILIPTGDS